MTQPRSKRQSWTELPPTNWAEREAHRVAKEVLRLRGRRSAQWLADRTKEIGYEVSRSVISDLENGRRRYVTTAEVVILAAALDTAPIALIYPGPYDDPEMKRICSASVIDVIPGVEFGSYLAAEWFSGLVPWSETEDNEHGRLPSNRRTYARNLRSLRAAREIAELHASLRSYLALPRQGESDDDLLAMQARVRKRIADLRAESAGESDA